MALTIPNKGDALADVQSILFKQHLDALVAGIASYGVTTEAGCLVSPSAGMVLSVAAGTSIRGNTTATIAAATPTVSAADVSLPRLDIVVIVAAGTIDIRAGTPAVNPIPPVLTADDIPLASVLVPAGVTTLTAGHIVDLRAVNTIALNCTFNNGGAGAASGTAYNGRVARTISYNTIGAVPLAGTGATGTWGIGITGNAATATVLATPRTLTIGSTGKAFDGSAAVTWTLAEIGAQAALGYTPVNKAGDTMTGNLSLIDGVTEKQLTLGSSGAYLYGTATAYGIWKTGGVSLSVNVSNGDFTTSGNITAYSDARLKMDLEVIPNALNKVQRLTGYTYTRIDSGVRQTGLIAQDVQAVLPEAVDPSGEYMSLAYGNLVGLLVEAIKEQQKQIDDLKARML